MKRIIIPLLITVLSSCNGQEKTIDFEKIDMSFDAQSFIEMNTRIDSTFFSRIDTLSIYNSTEKKFQKFGYSCHVSRPLDHERVIANLKELKFNEMDFVTDKNGKLFGIAGYSDISTKDAVSKVIAYLTKTLGKPQIVDGVPSGVFENYIWQTNDKVIEIADQINRAEDVYSFELQEASKVDYETCIYIINKKYVEELNKRELEFNHFGKSGIWIHLTYQVYNDNDE